MANKTDKALAEVKKHTKKFKKLFSLLIDTYIKALESDGELNASYLKEIADFLRSNGITLNNLVNLEMLSDLKHMSDELKGDLLNDDDGYSPTDFMSDLEPFQESELQ